MQRARIRISIAVAVAACHHPEPAALTLPAPAGAPDPTMVAIAARIDKLLVEERDRFMDPLRKLPTYELLAKREVAPERPVRRRRPPVTLIRHGTSPTLRACAPVADAVLAAPSERRCRGFASGHSDLAA